LSLAAGPLEVTVDEGAMFGSSPIVPSTLCFIFGITHCTSPIEEGMGKGRIARDVMAKIES
jgi:hypothetical protein